MHSYVLCLTNQYITLYYMQNFKSTMQRSHQCIIYLVLRDWTDSHFWSILADEDRLSLYS